MRLWKLWPVGGLPDGKDPWKPWYDKAFGFVIRAETEQDARNIANKNAGDENSAEWQTKVKEPWLDAKYSNCEELSADGKQELILKDFASA